MVGGQATGKNASHGSGNGITPSPNPTATSNTSPTTPTGISGTSTPVVNTNNVPFNSWTGIEDELYKWDWLFIVGGIVVVIIIIALALHR